MYLGRIQKLVGYPKNGRNERIVVAVVLGISGTRPVTHGVVKLRDGEHTGSGARKME
jgi:hypothetical protein